jgi:transcriptional regulator with XRE-family HTH domain|tara:strand:- start:21 stop:251 length:231 start_codon:yes stop_codon:yes gene_type:complete
MMQYHYLEQNMNISASFNHFMQHRGFTQAELCRESKMSPASLSLIIKNKRSPSFATLVLMAETFEVKLSEFIAAGE